LKNKNYDKIWRQAFENKIEKEEKKISSSTASSGVKLGARGVAADPAALFAAAPP